MPAVGQTSRVPFEVPAFQSFRLCEPCGSAENVAQPTRPVLKPGLLMLLLPIMVRARAPYFCHTGGVPVRDGADTFTKLHVWTLTQYRKVGSSPFELDTGSTAVVVLVSESRV
eukprot:7243776-Pyramimonas_sp.AAC.2